MIWNDATDVRFNGSTVQAVFCNNQMIWPQDREPDSYTLFYVSAKSGWNKDSEFGFNIYDGQNRKVFSTNGMHPVNSYTSQNDLYGVLVSGISPYRFTFSGSGVPYKVLVPTYSNFVSHSNGDLVLSGSGSFISASGELKDSKTMSSYPYPTSIDYDTSYTTKLSVQELDKQLRVSGSAITYTHSTVTSEPHPLDSYWPGALFLFAPLAPYTATYGMVGSSKTASAEAPTGTRSDIPVGYFQDFSSYLTAGNSGNPAVFDMFSSTEHSGDVTLGFKGPAEVHSAYNIYYAAAMSIFPTSVVSSSGNRYTLRAGQYFTPSSMAISTVQARPTTDLSGKYVYATLPPESASSVAYAGIYSVVVPPAPTGDQISSRTIKCSGSATTYYASAYIP